MSSDLDQSIGERIAALEGVESVEPVLLDAISMEESGLYGVVVQGLEPGNSFVRDQMLVEGHALTPGDGRAVMLGQILARNLDKHAGDRVEIYQDEFFDVVGVYDRRKYL